MKPPSTGTSPAAVRDASSSRRARARRVHVGHRRGVLGVGDEHLPRIDPGRGNLLRDERRRDHPAAGQLAHRQNLVGGPRRHVAVRRPFAHVRGQLGEILRELRGQRVERRRRARATTATLM